VNLDLLVIEVQNRIPDGNLPQSHPLGDHFSGGLHNQSIEIRAFSAPESGIFHLKGHGTGPQGLRRSFSLPVLQIHLHGNLPVQAGEGDFHPGLSFLGPQMCLHKVIIDTLLRTAQQIHIPENAAHAELVLILQIASVAPLQHQHRQKVLPFSEIFRHIELRGGVGHLAVPHILSVEPHIEAGVHTLKVQVSPGSRLILFPLEYMAVRAAGILLGHIGGIQGKRIVHIGVLVTVISMHLPHGGHRDSAPLLSRRHVLLVELLLQVIDAVIVAEIPLSVQKHETGGILSVLHQILLPSVRRYVVGSAGHGILMQDFQILIMSRHYHITPLCARGRACPRRTFSTLQYVPLMAMS
jgi:hypothetical protein